MKTPILSILVAVGLIGSASASVLTGTLTNGLVAYYPLHGDTKDYSGNANDISYVSSGINFTTDRFGVAQNALQFTTINDSAYSIRNLGISGNQSYSISWWNKKITGGNILSIGKFNGQTTANLFGVNTKELGQNELYIECSDQLLGSQYFNDVDTLGSSWHQLVYVYDGDLYTSKLYVDGIKYDFNYYWSSLSTQNINDSPFALGLGQNEIYSTMIGSISDIGIWSTALSSSQVSQLYSAQVVPEPSTYALFGIGAIGLLMVMRRKKTA